MTRCAAIDLGSLTVRLAVAEGTAAGFRIVLHRREITALGQGLAPAGLLAPEAMARTQAALEGFVRELAAWGVQTYRAVGTQALRQARNREDFLEKLHQSLGLAVQVLSPEEEARLSLKGVLSALSPDLQKMLLMVDVGGGSTEWALVRPEHSPQFASLPLGVLTLSQAQPVGDPPQPELVAALRAQLRSRLTEFYEQNFKPVLTVPFLLVGTAGAVTTLAAMHLKMVRYDAARINNLVLDRSQVAALAELVVSLPEAQRARLPGIEPAKAGVMVAGALLVQTIMEVTGQDRLVVIDAGLLEGVLSEICSEFSVSGFELTG